jgi:hypothetical protein
MVEREGADDGAAPLPGAAEGTALPVVHAASAITARPGAKDFSRGLRMMLLGQRRSAGDWPRPVKSFLLQ